MKDPMKPTQTPQSNHESIRDRVFSTIEEKKVAPTPCYVFWCQNSAMWLVWLLTVLLGALATAVLLFTSTYRYYDIYEAMHDNFVTFFLQALPVLWILAFVVLMFVAMRGMRATRRGYRLSPLVVGGSSVGVSVLLGVVASSLGFGFVVDKTLGEYAPMYHSQAEREQAMWQQPEQGRLIGVVDTTAATSDTYTTFIDSVGVAWVINTAELRPRDKELLASQQTVRVLGKEMVAKSDYFHACGVFPWQLDKKHAMRDLSANRKEHIERIYAHSYTAADRVEELEQVAFDQASADNVPSMKICAEIAAVRRVGEQMR